MGICPYDWGFDVEALREELLQEGTRRMLRQVANRNSSAARVTEMFLSRVHGLEAVLLESQPGR